MYCVFHANSLIEFGICFLVYAPTHGLTNTVHLANGEKLPSIFGLPFVVVVRIVFSVSRLKEMYTGKIDLVEWKLLTSPRATIVSDQRSPNYR